MFRTKNGGYCFVTMKVSELIKNEIDKVVDKQNICFESIVEVLEEKELVDVSYSNCNNSLVTLPNEEIYETVLRNSSYTIYKLENVFMFPNMMYVSNCMGEVESIDYIDTQNTLLNFNNYNDICVEIEGNKEIEYSNEWITKFNEKYFDGLKELNIESNTEMISVEVG